MKKNQLKSFINNIQQLIVTSPIGVQVAPAGVQPIIEKLIDTIYANRSNKGSLAPRKHIISQSLLKKFSHDELRETVHVNGYEEPVPTWEWLFCLPENNNNLWSQNIEVFFNFIEDHGSDALNEYLTAFDSDISKLTTKYTNPLLSYKEIEKRLLLSLYLAMHVQRMKTFKNSKLVSDKEFLDGMKKLTGYLFFHLWTWVKVTSPTFVVPVTTVVALNSGDHKEYIFPITPTVALVVAAENWESFIMKAYIFDDMRTPDDLEGIESALLCSSEEVGQQRFMIQQEATSYTVYHSNVRLGGKVRNEDYTFSSEIFSQVTETIKKAYPIHVQP